MLDTERFFTVLTELISNANRPWRTGEYRYENDSSMVRLPLPGATDAWPHCKTAMCRSL